MPLSVAGLSEVDLSAINEPLFEPSEQGRRVSEEFMKIGEHVAGVRPLLAQAMPNHFHVLLFVTREINRFGTPTSLQARGKFLGVRL